MSSLMLDWYARSTHAVTTYLSCLGVVMHVLEDWNQLELHVQGRGVALDHLGDLGAHIHGKRLGLGRKLGRGEDGGVQLHVVVGIESVANVVVDLFPLRDYRGDGTQRPKFAID